MEMGVTIKYRRVYTLQEIFYKLGTDCKSHYNKTMRITYKIIGIFAAVTVLASCVRKNEVIDPEPLPAGGIGGKATLRVTAQHHKKNINTGVVYIKYASKSMPVIDSFNATDTVDATNPTAVFEKLTQGDYYLYAKGTDYNLPQGNDEVMGGAHFRVIDTLEKTYDLYLQLDNPAHHEQP